MQKTVLLATLVGTLCAGCYNHTFVNPNVTPELEPSYSRWHNHWFFGVFTSTAELELDEVCPQGVARIEDVHTFVNGLLAALIGIVYSPTTVKVYCADTSTAVDVEVSTIDADRLRAMVAADPTLEARLYGLRDGMGADTALALAFTPLVAP